MTTIAATASAALSSAGDTASSPERAKLHEAAQAFEAILVRQMLASARAADLGGNDLLGQDRGNETFTQMRDERFAEIASKTGAFGLAAQIEAQLARMIAPATAAATSGAPNANEEG